MVSTVARPITGPTPGCVCRRRASSRACACCSTACSSGTILPSSSSSSLSNSSRRSRVQLSSGRASSFCRPAWLHSLRPSCKPCSTPCAATGSSPGSASAPGDVDGAATAAGRALPRSEPRFVETVLPPSAAGSASHPADHASVGAGRAAESPPHPPSITCAPAAPDASQTTAYCRSPRHPLLPDQTVLHKTSWPLRLDATACIRPTRPFPNPTSRSVESSDENHNRYTSYTASFCLFRALGPSIKSSLLGTAPEAVVMQSNGPLFTRVLLRARGTCSFVLRVMGRSA